MTGVEAVRFAGSCCMDAAPDAGAVPCSVPVKLDMRNYFLTYLDR